MPKLVTGQTDTCEMTKVPTLFCVCLDTSQPLTHVGDAFRTARDLDHGPDVFVVSGRYC